MNWTSVRSLLRMSFLVTGLVALTLFPAPAQANPLPVTGACCLYCSECQVLLEYECQLAEGMYLGDFTTCEPNPCSAPPVTFACCYPDGRCVVMDCERTCFLTGGGPLPTQYCIPNPCPTPAGACCFLDGRCEVRTQAACVDLYGGWMGADVPCSPNPCPPCLLPCGGACCLPDGSCQPLWQGTCEAHQGIWQGNGALCVPDPCVISSAPEPKFELRTTWGQVKSLYR